MIAERAFKTWETLVAEGVKRPESEADYQGLHHLMDQLTSRYDINQYPWSELFGLIAGYMHTWELRNEPELKHPEVPPAVMLAQLMKQRGVTQYQLEQAGIVDQGNLSKILKGTRGISKATAKRLSQYFGVSVELFI